MSSFATSFGIVDYLIFGIMLATSASIGIYYRFTGGKQKTTSEYLLANRNMSFTPVAFSLMASFMSAITLLGVAAENYMNGTQFVIINIAYIIGTPICAFVFLPVFFQIQATSAFEYLELRFSKATRLVASAVFMVQLTLYMSIVLYAPALTLSVATGIPKWIAVISVGIVCTFYCTIGGIKAVLWTDVFQSLLMFSAIFAVIAKGTMDVGSITKVWDISNKGEHIQFFNFDPDPTVKHSVWTLAVGGIFTYVSIYGINQAQVQRLLTVKTLKESQMALFLNWPITSLLSITTSLAGIVVYANLYDCDPLLRTKFTHVESADQILPYFVMKSLGTIPGLPGLFFAGVFSGALSTMSSAINSLAAVTFEDFIHPFCFRKASDSKMVTLTKIIALVYGVLCIALTYVVEQFGGILQASLTIFNVVGGPMLGLFSLGMLSHRAKTKSSLISFLMALAICFWIGFGSLSTETKTPNLHRSVDGCPNVTFLAYDTTHSPYTTEYNLNGTSTIAMNDTILKGENNSEHKKQVFPLYRLSYMWYAGLGWLIAFVLGFLGSLIEGGDKSVDPALLSPLVTRWSKKKCYTAEMIQLT